MTLLSSLQARVNRARLVTVDVGGTSRCVFWDCNVKFNSHFLYRTKTEIKVQLRLLGSWACLKIDPFFPRGSEPRETKRAPCIPVPVEHKSCTVLLVLVLVLVLEPCLKGCKRQKAHLCSFLVCLFCTFSAWAKAGILSIHPLFSPPFFACLL